MMAMEVIDARGHRCPVPTLKLRKALEAAAPGAVVRLLADDPMARIDVPHFATANGHEVVSTEDQAGAVAFTVRKAS
jgi:tRNA 2-thiouridine synthesizing protein A